jgi:signal transduction histidine kinase
MPASLCEIRRPSAHPRFGTHVFRLCFALPAVLIALGATALPGQTDVWETIPVYWVLALAVICLTARIASMIERCEREASQDWQAAAASAPPRRLELENPAIDVEGSLARLAHLEQMIVRQHRFVSDAAHELRTPLTAQSLVGESVLASQSASRAELRDAIVSMLEESKHMKRLIDGLLDLTRASLSVAPAQGTARQSAALDLSALARDCVESLRVLAEEKQQSIEVNATAPVWADVDLTMVRQALLNVIHNSIEHCPEGTHIQVDTQRSLLNEAIIQVRDNGPGIAAEEQNSVFERFYRGAGASRQRSLGLGLSIAKAVLCSQGGGIELLSSAGAGCCFALTVPLAAWMPTESVLDPEPQRARPRTTEFGSDHGWISRSRRRYRWA